MSKTLEDPSNAQYLADSYKASSREALTHIYDEWAGSYDAHAGKRNSAQPKEVAKTFLDVMEDKSAAVLDLGAGTGLIGDILKEQGYHDLSAFDPSQKMLDMAKGKGIYQTYHKGYLGDPLSFADNSFHAIVASGIFTVGHVDATVFPELNRILRVSGKMIFSINVKLLKDPGFDALIHHGAPFNWALERISPEFDMMDSTYSAAKAVVVVLSKRA